MNSLISIVLEKESIEISLTPDQEAALVRANTESNPKGSPPLVEFVESLIVGLFDRLVATHQQTDASNIAENLNLAATALTSDDREALKAIILPALGKAGIPPKELTAQAAEVELAST